MDEFATLNDIHNEYDEFDEKSINTHAIKQHHQYKDLYYRNILLLFCDKSTYDELSSKNAEIRDARRIVQFYHGILELQKLFDPNNPMEQEFYDTEICKLESHDVENVLKKSFGKDGNKDEKKFAVAISRLNGILKSIEKSPEKLFPNGWSSELIGSYSIPVKQFREESLEKAKELYCEKANCFWTEVTKLVTIKDESEKVKFLYDHRANETFASLAMDGILALCGQPQEECGINSLRERLERDNIKPKLTEYINCLKKILPEAKPLFDTKGKLNDDTKNIFTQEKKFIGLAWYTHIRELIDLMLSNYNNSTHTNLNCIKDQIKSMRILSLPGGGFTGDWHLQVQRGSVSEALGNKIREQILNPIEDFKRFTEGVGLPSWPRHDSKILEIGYEQKRKSEHLCNLEKTAKERFTALQRFGSEKMCNLLKAWPGSSVSLQDVLTLHRFAHRRSDIINYSLIRNELYAVIEDIRRSGDVSGTGLSTIEYSTLILELLKR